VVRFRARVARRQGLADRAFGCRLYRVTRRRASGCTSNTLSGVRVIPSYVPRLLSSFPWSLLLTLCCIQWDLKTEAPDLFLHLSNSDLVIFKGDLNHRKLTYDCHHPPTEGFETAIGPLASEPGTPPVLSLRTIKSDVVVGLPAGMAERLDKEEPGWKISGKYAVVLLTEGHKGERVSFT
jgi:hypothetical protein